MSVFGVIGPYFPAFELSIQSECGKIRTGITPNTDIFYAVIIVTPLASIRISYFVEKFKFIQSHNANFFMTLLFCLLFDKWKSWKTLLIRYRKWKLFNKWSVLDFPFSIVFITIVSYNRCSYKFALAIW